MNFDVLTAQCSAEETAQLLADVHETYFEEASKFDCWMMETLTQKITVSCRLPTTPSCVASTLRPLSCILKPFYRWHQVYLSAMVSFTLASSVGWPCPCFTSCKTFGQLICRNSRPLSASAFTQVYRHHALPRLSGPRFTVSMRRQLSDASHYRSSGIWRGRQARSKIFTVRRHSEHRYENDEGGAR